MPASSGSESATQIIKRSKEDHHSKKGNRSKNVSEQAKSSTLRPSKQSKHKNQYIISDDEGFEFEVMPTAYY